jgi:hypothetical protein
MNYSGALFRAKRGLAKAFGVEVRRCSAASDAARTLPISSWLLVVLFMRVPEDAANYLVFRDVRSEWLSFVF